MVTLSIPNLHRIFESPRTKLKPKVEQLLPELFFLIG